MRRQRNHGSNRGNCSLALPIGTLAPFQYNKLMHFGVDGDMAASMVT